MGSLLCCGKLGVMMRLRDGSWSIHWRCVRSSVHGRETSCTLSDSCKIERGSDEEGLQK